MELNGFEQTNFLKYTCSVTRSETEFQKQLRGRENPAASAPPAIQQFVSGINRFSDRLFHSRFDASLVYWNWETIGPKRDPSSVVKCGTEEIRRRPKVRWGLTRDPDGALR